MPTQTAIGPRNSVLASKHTEKPNKKQIFFLIYVLKRQIKETTELFEFRSKKIESPYCRNTKRASHSIQVITPS